MGINANISAGCDPEFIRRLQNGDIAAFEKLFKQYSSRLVQFSFYITSDRQAAEDIAQDVFIRLWERRRRIRSDVDIQSYLFTAVRNRSLNFIRHEKIVRSHRSRMSYRIKNSSEIPDDLLHARDLENAINRAIESLPEKRRIIFYLHRFDGMSYLEISIVLKISVKTVETQIRRSVRYLEKQLFHFLTLHP